MRIAVVALVVLSMLAALAGIVDVARAADNSLSYAPPMRPMAPPYYAPGPRPMGQPGMRPMGMGPFGMRPMGGPGMRPIGGGQGMMRPMGGQGMMRPLGGGPGMMRPMGGPGMMGGPGIRLMGAPGLRPLGPRGGPVIVEGMPPRFGAPGGRVCFNPAETRDKIAAHGLTEPFQALRTGRFQGEALRARLCRWKPDEFVYEVAVLRRDGRIVHIYMNAQNGQTFGAFNDPDRQ